jgi:hypothetical protein
LVSQQFGVLVFGGRTARIFGFAMSKRLRQWVEQTIFIMRVENDTI